MTHAVVLSLAPPLAVGPTPVDEALSHVERLRGSLVESRAVDAELRAHIAGLLAMRGDVERARREYRLAIRDMQELGMRLAVLGMRQLGWELGLASGDWRAAERELRAGYEEGRRLGDRGYLATIAAELGEAVLLQGREQEAEVLSHESEETAAVSDIDAQVRWRRLRSLVLVERDPQRAEHLIREAVRLADQTDMPAIRASALADCGRVLRRVGRCREAHDVAMRALDLATTKGHRGLAARAVALLRELDAGS
jgi:hypothetical protein